MLLKINKTQSLQEANPNIDLAEFMPTFANCDDTRQKVIALYYDSESPFSRVSREQKVDNIARYISVNTSDVDDIINECAAGDILFTARKEYQALSPNPELQMYLDSLEYISSMSEEIRSNTARINDKEDKVFERSHKFEMDKVKLYENITYYRKELGLGTALEDMEETKSDGKNLMRATVRSLQQKAS